MNTAPALNSGYSLAGSTVSTGVVGTSGSAQASDYRVTPLAPFPGINTTPAANWTTGHTYAVDDLVTSDSGKQYQAVSAGVAGATAPTGTGTAISDGTVTWDFVGLVHTGAAKFSTFLYQAGTPYPEFIGVRGYNLTDGSGGRMDTTEYSWGEQITWGWSNTGGGANNRSAEWLWQHTTPGGTSWHPWDTNLDGAASENPTFTIQVNVTPSICAFTFNSNGIIFGTAAQPREQLHVAGTGRMYLGGSSGGVIVFEGATNNAYNTSISVVDPAGSSKTINFPDASGTVAVVPSLTAFTQTYATASHTHAAITSAALATTAATNVVPYGFATQAQADNIATQFNLLRTDLDNLKQLVNAAIDDGQLSGVFA